MTRLWCLLTGHRKVAAGHVTFCARCGRVWE